MHCIAETEIHPLHFCAHSPTLWHLFLRIWNKFIRAVISTMLLDSFVSVLLLLVCLCMWINVFASVFVLIYICMLKGLCLCYTCLCMCLYVFASVFVPISVCMCICSCFKIQTSVFPSVYICVCVCVCTLSLSVKPALRLPRPEMTDRVGCSAGDRGRETKTFLRRNCIWTEILTIIDRSKVLCFAFLVFCYF